METANNNTGKPRFQTEPISDGANVDPNAQHFTNGNPIPPIPDVLGAACSEDAADEEIKKNARAEFDKLGYCEQLKARKGMNALCGRHWYEPHKVDFTNENDVSAMIAGAGLAVGLGLLGYVAYSAFKKD